MSYYKYRKLSDENHVNAIVGNQLWFARSDTFNDPFDGRPPMDLITYESMALFVKNHTALGNKLLPQFFHEVVMKQIEEARTLYNNGTFYEKHPMGPYKRLMEERTFRSFIFGLSQVNTNVLMWSHYADSHKGFCVRYNLDVILNHLDIFFHKEISYSKTSDKKIDAFGTMIDIDDPDLLTRSLFIKSEDWQYEKEYRLILNDFSENPNDKHRTVILPDNSIDRIYFGMEAKTEEKLDFIKRLEGREIEFYNMRPAKETFEVFPEVIVNLNNP